MDHYVLITGGALNIGRGIATRAETDGYRPIILDITPPEDLGGCEYHQVDLSDVEATAEVMDRVVHNRLVTRLVNNVGIVKPAALADLDLADVQAVMGLNVRVSVQCAQALLPSMREVGFGRIVNIASRTVLGKELRTLYSASKAGQVGLAKTWAIELAKYGITANVVAPGTIETTAFHRNNPPEDPRTHAIIDAIPAGRIGTPEDIANAVSFFLAEQASFVNGQVMYVCGGLTAGRAPV
ncbi:MAG: SDR family oxidoreductase [Motiliproteus sp.]